MILTKMATELLNVAAILFQIVSTLTSPHHREDFKVGGYSSKGWTSDEIFRETYFRSYVGTSVAEIRVCPFFTGAHQRPTPSYFKRSKGRRTTGSEFSAPSPPAATSLLAGFEWIFLAFPLAAGVTRLRLKYLLVDFATMGTLHSLSPSLPFFPLPWAFTQQPLTLSTEASRASKNSPPGKKFYVTFPLRSPPSLPLRAPPDPSVRRSFHLDGFRSQLSTLSPTFRPLRSLPSSPPLFPRKIGTFEFGH